MINLSTLEDLLSIRKPWYIKKLSNNSDPKKLEVWIDTKKKRNLSFFSKQVKHCIVCSSIKAQLSVQRWCHVSINGLKIFINAEIPNVKCDSAQCHFNHEYLGDKEFPFTSSMSETITKLFSVNPNYKSICKALNIDYQDVLKVRCSNNGSCSLPDKDHPVWKQISNGKIKIETRHFALKLIIGNAIKIQQNAKDNEKPNAEDKEILKQRIAKLVKYFQNHYSRLQYEIEQIQNCMSSIEEAL